jgi:phage terminase large subunit-like protein
MPQVTIEANPHEGQKQVHNSPARFVTLAAGRRWGKTRLGVNECLDVASRGGRAWWVSPSYKTSEVGWRPLRQIARRLPGADIRLVDRMVTLPGGGFVAVRSADNPDSLRGEGLDFCVMDECAFMKKEAWTEAIRPSLSDRQGKALFISTPRGRNWFWENYQHGLAGNEGWASFSFPTSSNPYIAETEIEAAKRDLPELIFRQEYLAEFIDDEGSVFRRVQEAIRTEMIDQPVKDRQYIAGVDVAASVDYTVISVMDVQSKNLVYKDRFNRVDYNVLEDRLESVYKRFKMDLMKIEANSIGQGVIDHLRNRNMNIIPFTTTNATKQTIITNLQSAFEHGEIGIYNDPVLIGELLSYESKRTPSGSFSYNAPDGLHDDCVMSLALAWDCIYSGSSVILFGG